MALLLGACTPSLQPGPPRLFSIDQQTAAVRQQIGLADFAYYASLDPARRRDYRNTTVSGQIYAIDLAYNSYEASLTQERQDLGLLSTTALLGLTSASTLVPAVATKNILTTAATGVAGLDAGYNEQVLLKQTVQTLQIQMRARRAQLSAQIIANLRLGDEQYPLATALSDVESYYQAGTLTGALIDVSNAASEHAVAAEAIRNQVISYNLAGDSNAASLRRRAQDPATYRKIKALLQSYGVDALVGDVVSLPQYADVRARLVADLPIITVPAPAPAVPPIVRRPDPGPIGRREPPPAPRPVPTQSLDDNAVLIARFISPGGHFDASRADAVKRVAVAKGVTVAASRLMEDSALATVRAEIVAELGLR